MIIALASPAIVVKPVPRIIIPPVVAPFVTLKRASAPTPEFVFEIDTADAEFNDGAKDACPSAFNAIVDAKVAAVEVMTSLSAPAKVIFAEAVSAKLRAHGVTTEPEGAVPESTAIVGVTEPVI